MSIPTHFSLKSVTPSRIAANLKIPHLVSGLERHKRFNFPAICGYDVFEEVGEEAVRKAAVAAGPANKTKFSV